MLCWKWYLPFFTSAGWDHFSLYILISFFLSWLWQCFGFAKISLNFLYPLFIFPLTECQKSLHLYITNFLLIGFVIAKIWLPFSQFLVLEVFISKYQCIICILISATITVFQFLFLAKKCFVIPKEDRLCFPAELQLSYLKHYSFTHFSLQWRNVSGELFYLWICQSYRLRVLLVFTGAENRWHLYTAINVIKNIGV